MGLTPSWFHKRIRILPWVYLNISKSGFSFSLGPQGLSVNLGQKGVKVTAGIPGTGLSASHAFARPRPATINASQTTVSALADVEVTIAKVDILLKELRFAAWLENYLTPDSKPNSSAQAPSPATDHTDRL